MEIKKFKKKCNELVLPKIFNADTKEKQLWNTYNLWQNDWTCMRNQHETSGNNLSK